MLATMTDAEIQRMIADKQAMQRRYSETHPLWQSASAILAELFGEMNRRTTAKLIGLAHQAVSLEWASDEQMDAENAFAELAKAQMTQAQSDEWDAWCLKATTEEMIQWALDALGIKHGVACIDPTDTRIDALMAQALGVGDLYTAAVCQIALLGYPRKNTWERLDTPEKLALQRGYLVRAGVWQREAARHDMTIKGSAIDSNNTGVSA